MSIKRLKVWLFRFLTLTILGVATGCAPPDVTPELDSAAEQLRLPSDGIGPNDVGPDDAQAIVSAHQVLHTVAPEDYRLGRELDELDQALLRAAQQNVAATQRPALAPSTSAIDPTAIGHAERKSIARQAEAVLLEVSERYAKASADQALQRLIEAEAELTTLHSDFKRLLPSPQAKALPADPLGLAPSDALHQRLEGLQREHRQLQVRVALSESVDGRALLREVDKATARVKGVLASAEHISFHASRGDILGKLKKTSWEKAILERPQKAEAARARLRQVAEAIDGRRAITMSTEWIRGPPVETVDAAVMASIRNYDLDVQNWSRAEARLESFTSAVRSGGNLLEVVKSAESPRAVQLLFVSDTTLAGAIRQLEIFEIDNAKAAGSDELRRTYHDREWLKAARDELLRRKAGGRTDIATSLHGELTEFKGASLSSRAESRLVVLAQDRFQSTARMPKSLVVEIRRILGLAMDRSLDSVGELVGKYKEVNRPFAVATDAVELTLRDERIRLRNSIAGAAQRLREYSIELLDKGVVLTETRQRQIEKFTAWFLLGGGNDPPEPAPAGNQRPRPRGPDSSPSRAASTLVFGTDAKLEAALADAKSIIERIDLVERSNRDYLSRAAVLVSDAREISSEPRPFATEKGRRVIAESTLRVRNVQWTKATMLGDMTRLPERNADWMGRLAKDGKPFDFHRDVVNFKTFQAVGGGIHFGDTGTLRSDFDLSEFALVYDAATRQLRLVGPNSQRFVLDDVDPQVLKSLYRFSDAGRNAAISIGWGSERVSGLEILQRGAQRDGRTVLLDPYFVDTTVGQDLILADSIPWELDEKTLPNGEPVPSALNVTFAAALKEFHQTQARPFLQLAKSVAPYSYSSKAYWITQTADFRIGSVLEGLLTHDKTSDAVEWVRANHSRRFAQSQLRIQEYTTKQGDFDVEPIIRQRVTDEYYESFEKQIGITVADAREALRVELTRSRTLQRKKTYPFGSLSDLDRHPGGGQPLYREGTTDTLTAETLEDMLQKFNDKRRDLPHVGAAPASERESEYAKALRRAIEELERLIDQRTRETVAKLDEAAEKDLAALEPLFKDLPPASKRAIRQLIGTVVSWELSNGKAKRALVDLWIALVREDPKHDQSKLASVVELLVNPTTLAVLLDDPTEIWLDGSGSTGRIRLEGRMRYRYATQRVVIDGDTIELVKGHDNSSEAITLDAATSLANEHLEALNGLYPPLKRVAKYAQLAAFLRWADQAEKRGQLGMLDLADLGAIPGNDRSETSTPDAIDSGT